MKNAAASEDRALCVSLSVPLPTAIAPQDLVAAFRCAADGGGEAASASAAHLDRLLSEMSATEVLRFCDRHGFSLRDLRHAYRWNRARGGAPHPELEEHLEQR
jgi:hypothetical protein